MTSQQINRYIYLPTPDVATTTDYRNQIGTHTPRNIKQNRRNSFSHRTVNFWNNLPKKLIDAPSLNSFRNWDKYDLRYNFERCLLLESHMLQGLGT